MVFTMLHQSSAEQGPREVLPVLLALICLVIAGGAIVLLIRRYIYRSPSDSSPGFTLQDLRDLHKSGQLTNEEFDRAKSLMIGRVGGPEKSDNKGVSPGNSED